MEKSTSRLFVTYHQTYELRQQELDFCLSLNEVVFDEVYVLAENCPKPGWCNSHWSDSPDRKKFKDIALIANQFANPNDLTVIANSDIIIPKAAERQINAWLDPHQCYCLAKWDITPTKGIRPWVTGWSQDAWCFKGRIKNADNIGNYYFGLPGCDNRLAWEISQSDYVILNPSMSIKTYHFHLSNQRSATNDESRRVPAPYLLVTPHYLGQQPELAYLEKFSAPHNHFNALW